MATAEELKIYLNKRGFVVDITEDGMLRQITLLNGDVSALAEALGMIKEPGQFVIHLKIDEKKSQAFLASQERKLEELAGIKRGIWQKVKGLANIIKRVK